MKKETCIWTDLRAKKILLLEELTETDCFHLLQDMQSLEML